MAAYPSSTYREILETRLRPYLIALTSQPQYQGYFTRFPGSKHATHANISNILGKIDRQLTSPYPSEPDFFTKLPIDHSLSRALHDQITRINDAIEELETADVALRQKVNSFLKKGGRKRTRMQNKRNKSRRKSRR